MTRLLALPILANVLLLAAAALAMLNLGQREAGPDPSKPTGAGGRIGRFVEDLAEGIRVVTHFRLLGIMLALSAVGSLVGARFAVRVIRKSGARGTAVISVLVSGASIVALAWTRELGLASSLLAFNGAAVTVWNVMTITIRQATVEPRMLGRVSSTYLVLARTALPVGAGLAGLLAAATGTSTVFLVFGGFLMLSSAVLLPMLWKVFGQSWARGLASAQKVRAEA